MKALLALLLKGALGKWLVTVGSMFVSMAVYSFSYGWSFAIGFVLLILVHELGHFIAARQCSLVVGAPVFIPFVGAWIALKEEKLDPNVEAHVAIAGPLLGSTAAYICYLFGVSGQGHIYMVLAQAGFILNLFNLIPLTPLDGGRLSGVISPKLWLVGIPILIGVFIYSPSPLLVIIGILAIPRALSALKQGAHQSTLPSLNEKIKYGGIYLTLAISLCVMWHEAHEWLS